MRRCLILVIGTMTFAAACGATPDARESSESSRRDDSALEGACVPDGGWDDVLSLTSCCSGVAVPGTTVCTDPADYGTSWTSCYQVCGTAPTADGCIPGGGVDDVLNNTACCSGLAAPGSTVCANPADYGTTWASCYHVCESSPTADGCIAGGGITDAFSSTRCCYGVASTVCAPPGNISTECYQVCANDDRSVCDGALCEPGAAMQSSCNACTQAVCAADAYCCTSAWDGICVGEVTSICGINCT